MWWAVWAVHVMLHGKKGIADSVGARGSSAVHVSWMVLLFVVVVLLKWTLQGKCQIILYMALKII